MIHGATFRFVQDRDGRMTRVELNGRDITQQVSDINIYATPSETAVTLVFNAAAIDVQIEDLAEYERRTDGVSTEVRLVRPVGGLHK